MWGLLVIAVVWVLFGPLAALVSAGRANRRIEGLEAELRRLRAELQERAEGIATPPFPEDAPAAAAAPARSTPAIPLPSVGPLLPPDTEAAGAAPGPWQALEPGVASDEEPTRDAVGVPPQPAPTGGNESLETKIGGRWTVLVGGLALALGAIFLVRYSIEQGLVGPGTRIALGLLLALVLFALGEGLRRRDRALAMPPVFAKADVPAILTGAGAIALFATLYAAHALYGFIGPPAAFVLLTAAGLVTLFLSVIHGPALAALGTVGSYVAPVLVTSAEPAALPVALHVLAVTAAVLGMARIRLWPWLAAIGIAASFVWGLLLAGTHTVDTLPAALLLLAGLAAIFVIVFAAGLHSIRVRDVAGDPFILASLAAVAVLSFVYAESTQGYPAVTANILIVGLLGAVASRWPAAAGAAVVAGIVAVVTVMLVPSAGFGTYRMGDFAWAIVDASAFPAFVWKATALGALIGAGSFVSADRAAASAPRTAGLFASAGALAPPLILVVVYLRHTPFETRPLVGVSALIMAAVFAAFAERLIAKRADPLAPAPALYAAGSVLALSLACAVGLSTRFIPISLALGAAGVAWVSLYRPIRVLSWLAVVMAGLALAAIALGPPFTPAEIGTWPILNGLVLRLGLPAAAVLFAGETLRRHRDGIEAQILQTFGLVLAAVFVLLEIRHFVGGGVISTGPAGLGEQSAMTLAALAFSLGLQRIALRTRSKVYRAGSLIAGIIGAAAIAVSHLVTANPLLTGESVGTGAVFNLLLPGYLVPAVAAAWVAAEARPVRPRWYVLLVAALALLLAFAYVTLMVRHVFEGEYLDRFGIVDGENWTYSAVWLGFGILLLAAGILLRSTMVRAASALVIAVVVFKVFLFDMAALTGALRAASFLGLGAALIIIGRLYQRLLARQRPAGATP